MSSEPRWVTTSFPRRATLDTRRPEPAEYLVGMMRQALRHGLPARRPAGRTVAWVGRHGFPTAPVTAALRRLPAHADPSLDALLLQITERWPELAGRSRRLPAQPPALTALAVARSGARTVFVFSGPVPLLVVKQPNSSPSSVVAEVAALRRAEPADIAPRVLGEVDGAPVQEGLPGRPPAVTAVSPRDADALAAPPAFAQLGQALARLAVATAVAARLDERFLVPLDAALRSGLLGAATAERVVAARSELADLDVSVLQHGDLSAQNWLVGPEGFTGVVDWEMAVDRGVPGFDALHAGVSMLEHGIGLVRWSDERVGASFAAAWARAPLFTAVRTAFGASASAAGVPDRLLESLQVAFFARRLGRRVQRPGAHAVEAPAAARMLEAVCGS